MIEEVTCSTANEFIEYLRPSNKKWNGPLKSWLFRGQRDSKWNLEPSIFRHNNNHWPELQSPLQGGYNEQCERELKIIRRFVKGADDIGLHIPGDSCEFRMLPTYSHICRWPDMKILEILAIAQHHGIPTRLLDFSYNGLIAAHFALTDAFDEEKNLDKKSDPYLAVWVFGLDRYWKSIEPNNRRIQIVSAPSSSNMYLFKQNGSFIYDGYLKSIWEKNDTINKTIFNLNSTIETELKENNIDNEMILSKVKLPKTEAKKALEILYKEGLTHSYLMPNYDSVVKTLELENRLRFERL